MNTNIKADDTFYQIEVLKTKIEKLKKIYMFRGLDEDYQTLITIGTFPACEHELYPLALEFKEKIIAYYEDKLKKLEVNYIIPPNIRE